MDIVYSTYMPLRREVFVDGEFYHIFNRGLNKRQIFFGQRDYKRFFKKLEELVDETSHQIHAFCLMPNHFHILIRQEGDNSLTDFMNRLQGSYGKYINIKRDQKGRVYDGRFKAQHIDSEEYLIYVSKYIHRNPLEAKLVTRLSDYRWSSYGSYLNKDKVPLVTEDLILGYFSKKKGRQQDYKEFVEEVFVPEEIIYYAPGFIDVDM